MDKALYEFGQEMMHLMPHFIREIHNRIFKPIKSRDITMPQLAILDLLHEKKRCMMSEIAKALSVTTSATTGIIDRMVRSDLLKRGTSDNDRRIINIEMTRKGRDIIDGIQKRRSETMLKVFGRLKPIERERYLETVKKVYSILREGTK
ncbi:MAG: MarR family transcriptional regulator [Candidatus Omnitrophica bacterium]|nr:MarR family transcriptional regulator [Candidatus Omnitrophota bacterium]